MVMEVSGGAVLVFIVIISVMSPLEAETTFYQGLPAPWSGCRGAHVPVAGALSPLPDSAKMKVTDQQTVTSVLSNITRGSFFEMAEASDAGYSKNRHCNPRSMVCHGVAADVSFISSR